MTTLILILTVIVLVTILFLFTSKKPNFYPPGPIWLPIVGCLPIFKKRMKKFGALYLSLDNLAKEYETSILGLKLGFDHPTVCVFDYENIKTVLTSDEFEGRPNSFFFRLRTMGKRKGITFTDGEHWQEQRSFVMRHLREVGFGKKTMDDIIIDELKDLLQYFDQYGNHITMENFFSPNILSVLWYLTAGTRIARDNPTILKMLDLLKRRQKAFDMSGGVLNQFPWLRFIAPEKTGYNLIVRLNLELKNFFMEIIHEHMESFTGEINDLIYAFISEMIRDKSQKTRFTEDQLLMVCLDLFIAGSQTTSSTLDFIFYELVLNRKIQEKLQMEIDKAVPKSRLPEVCDRTRMPYVQAFLMEIRRKYPIVTIGGPRRTLIDSRIDKYFVPKGTSILYSIWNVHMNESYWEKPALFNPERFIGSDNKFHANERVINFGLGKRRCPGEALAKNCIFLFTTGILQNFNILPVPKQSLPKMDIYPGITMTPKPYSIQFERR